jgi:branched-chain amino acid transport system substrate-binding protein
MGSKGQDTAKPPAAISKRKTTIGAILPETGSLAKYGRECARGMALAMEESDANGGPAVMLKLFFEDDKGNPKLAREHVNHLVTNKGAVAILGPITSDCAATAGPLAQKLNVPLITPSATSFDVTQAGDCVSRVCYIDPMQGYVMASFAVTSMGKKLAGVVFEKDSPYSSGLAQSFENAFKALGGKIAFVSQYVAGEKEFAHACGEVKKNLPDIVFVPGYYRDVASFATAVRAAGTHERLVTLMGGDGWDVPELLSIAPAALEQAYFCTHYSHYEKDERVVDFVKTYGQKYPSETPSVWAALGYDAAALLLDSITRAQSTDPAKIKDAINATAAFKGVTGVIALDKHRNPLKSAVIMKIERGKAVYETRVSFISGGGY